MYTKRLLILVFQIIYSSLIGQDVLSLEEAVGLALERNYGIKIANLQQRAEEMQVYKANAGMGPTVDANAFFTLRGNNVNQNFTDGRVINRWGRAYNPGVNISADLTIYDGGRMQATYERLGLQSQFAALQAKIIVQNTVADVMQAYYDIIRQKETVDFLNAVIKYYEERLKITEERWKVGQGSKIDYLQSKTDLNAQLSDLNRAKLNYQNAKVLLNGLLNRPPDYDFMTEAYTAPPVNYRLEDLIAIAGEKNRDLLVLQKAYEINQKSEEELAADLKPQLSLNGGVGYTYNNTNAGFLLSNRSVFANVGLTARWNIYDGGDRKNQLAISQINSDIIAQQQEELLVQVKNDLTQAYNRYKSDLELMTFEQENKATVEENLEISLEKFRLGASTILELNEAQRTYDTALNRLVDAQFNLRVSELELMRISGVLIE